MKETMLLLMTGRLHPPIEAIFIVLILFLLILFIYVAKPKKKASYYRHRYKIRQAKKTLQKLNGDGFGGEFKNGTIMNYLKKIDPYVFEELLLEAFELKGYKIKRNRSYSGDGGIDGTIYNEKGETILIQAKRYKSFVNTQHLRDFDLLTSRQRVKAGYFIHTGRTPASFRFVFSADIQIISGSKLIDLVLMATPQKQAHALNGSAIIKKIINDLKL